jgi:hypothetical protein
MVSWLFSTQSRKGAKTQRRERRRNDILAGKSFHAFYQSDLPGILIACVFASNLVDWPHICRLSKATIPGSNPFCLEKECE